MRSLGSAEGLAHFEAKHRVRIPEALREFYGCVHLACFLEGGAIDGEIVLRDLDDLYDDPPLVPIWPSGLHAVFAFHGHSGLACAAAVGIDNPPVYWGSEDGPGRSGSDATIAVD